MPTGKMPRFSVMQGYWTMEDDKVVVSGDDGEYRYEYEATRKHMRLVWQGCRDGVQEVYHPRSGYKKMNFVSERTPDFTFSKDA